MLEHPREAPLGAVSPDGKWLLTSSSGGLVHRWDATTGLVAGPPQRCGDFCSGIAFSPDSSRYLASSQDGTVRVWATVPRPRSRPYQHNAGRGDIRAFALDDGSGFQVFSPDGRRRVEWTRNGSARSVPGPGLPPRPLPHPRPIEAASFCDDGSRLVVAGGGFVRAWDADGITPAGPEFAASPLRPQRAPGRPGLPHPLRLSRDGTRIVTWDDAQTFSVWDLTSGRRVFGPSRHPEPGPIIFGEPALAGRVQSIALSPDGRRLAVGIISSGTLTVWDVENGGIVHHNKRFRGSVWHMRYSDDGRRILVFTTDGLARVYDASTGDLLGPGVSQPERWNLAAASPDVRRLAVVDLSTKTIRVLDMDRGEQLLDIPCDIGKEPPKAV